MQVFLEILVSVVALGHAAWSAILFVWQKQRKHPLWIFAADKIGYVINASGKQTALRLRLTVVNKATRLVVLNRLEGILTPTKGDQVEVRWARLLPYGAESHEPESAYPVAVPGQSSVPLFVEFTFPPVGPPFSFLAGDLTFTMKGVIDGNRPTQVRLKGRFSVLEDVARYWCMDAVAKQQTEVVHEAPFEAPGRAAPGRQEPLLSALPAPDGALQAPGS